MKKLVCCLMAAALLIPAYLPVYAEDGTSSESQQATASQSGSLMVDIDLKLPLVKRSPQISASLSKGSDSIKIDVGTKDRQTAGTIDGQAVQMDVLVNPDQPDDEMIHALRLDASGLPQGTYTLTLQGMGMRTVKQNVVIDTYSKYLHVDDLSVMMIGDVNQDGNVNDADYDAVRNAIDTTNAEQLSAYDLNRDGVVDVLDLSYVHQTLGNVPADALESLGNPLIDASMITLETAEALEVVEGSIADILNKDTEQPLKVGYSNDQVSVSDAPIELPLKINSDPIKMNKIDLIPGNGEHAVTDGVVLVTYEDENGLEQHLELPFNQTATYALTSDHTSDVIVIDLGKQVAVKEITIRVTGTRTNKNLAEIAKVEFLNDVYEKIPEPKSAYPNNVKAIAGNESLQITWDSVVNVTGYEVKYSGLNPKTNKIEVHTVKTATNSVKLTKLTNFVTYTIAVQSVNGDWTSGYGNSIMAMPIATSVPKMVTGVNAKGSYRAIQVSWSKAENALTYQVYYRIKGQEEYTRISDLKTTSVKLENLEDGKTYQIYITASNDLGEGPKSAVVAADTTNVTPVIVPKYNLINRSTGIGNVTAGIKNVTYPSKINPNDYPYEFDQFDIVDDDETSYWNFASWDAGGYNAGKPSPIVEFDEAHTFGEFVVVPSYNFVGGLAYVKVQYWDENGKSVIVNNASMKEVRDANGSKYYRIVLKQPITTNKVQINVAQYWTGNNNIKLSEMKFYTYDSIADEINELFIDDLQIQLREDVTQATIDTLRTRLNTENQGEKHPDYANLSKDLQYAEDILQDKDLSDEITVVDQMMSTKNDAGKGNSYPLSDLQPLGVAARAGDSVTVYLGKAGSAKGNVQVVFTQPFATPDKWQVVQTLKPGKNIITVPQITSKDIERGGSLYLRYVGQAPAYEPSQNPIKVRVSGGVKIPVLDVSGVEDQAEMEALSGTYIDELEAYVNKLQTMYADSEYQPAVQALNVTEVASDQMLFSLPATEAWKGIKKGSDDRQTWINNLVKNEQAVEQLMDLTYAQKGFLEDAADAVDQKPRTRINIRYMDVQTAFMYAGGSHIGIPFGSSSGMMKGSPATCASDASQKCEGGALYGWGISHEIGHVLDQTRGAFAEVSNNVVALYSSTIDEEYFSRIGKYKDDYTEIYQKVTSGTKGYSSSVFVQLGMYWQLHLAYDDAWIRPDDTNVFTARMYQAYRQEPASKANYDNLLIRMASKAAGKDLRDYFAHWGLEADEETAAWLKEQGYQPETKPIYYLNETARRKRIEGTADMSAGTTLSASLRHDASNGNDSKRAQLTMSVNQDEDRILGYEIYRNGEVIAFTNEPTFTDTITTINNRVFTYEVIAYDYNLNPTNRVTLDPVKISHDGSIAKQHWTYTSNVLEDQEQEGADEPVVSTLNQAFDNDPSTVYTGSVKKGNVELIIDLNTSQPLVGFKYTKATDALDNVKNYEVQISQDKVNWQTVAKGSLSSDQAYEKVFFSSDDDYISNKLETMDAQYVKFIAKQTSVSIAELDLLAPPGDNIEFNAATGVGILKEDYTYAPEKTIKKGSLVFTGEYRGNPAFNAVLLLDEQDRILGGDGEEGIAKSILMATIPENSPLDEIASGTWIYWIEPETLHDLPATVKAELYRVDDAVENTGQRLVSDTLPMTMPEYLPEISLTGSMDEK